MCRATLGAIPVWRWTWAASETFSKALRGTPGWPNTLKRVPELPNAQDGSSMRWVARAALTAFRSVVMSFLLRGSAQKPHGHAAVDRDQQPGRHLQRPAGQGQHRLGHVLGQDLPLEQGPLGVVLAQVLLLDAVDPGPVGPPAAGEDARPADHPVGVDAVDADPVLAELGGEEADLVGLGRLGRGVGDVLGPG